MTVGCFLDKLHQPTPAELAAVMGPAFPLWQRLTRFIADTYQMEGELSYGGKNYGWNLWVRKSGKSLVSLYPHAGSVVAQVVLGKAQVEQALTLNLGEKVSRLLRETPQLHDGKWLFIPVTDETDAQDVEQLLLVKKRPVKRN
jgi:hypothetical protein